MKTTLIIETYKTVKATKEINMTKLQTINMLEVVLGQRLNVQMLEIIEYVYNENE